MDADFLVAYVYGRHSVRDYFDRFVMESAFADAFAECLEVRRRCTVHLWSAFAELDASPRTDAFWAGSNMRTTFTKLRDFYTKQEPLASLDWTWRSFTISLCEGNADRFGAAAETLLRANELRMSEFLRLSLNLLYVSGWQTEQLAADVSVRMGMVDDARTSLLAIIDVGTPEHGEWARRVLEHVTGAA